MTLESGFDIPETTMTPATLNNYDLVLVSPFHGNLSYRSSMAETNIVLGSGEDALHVDFRNDIVTQSGQTRYNLLDIWIPGKDMKSKNIILKLANKYPGMEIKRILRGKSDFDGHYRTALVIEISPQIRLTDNKIEVLVFIDGKYYGTIPFTVHVSK